AVALMLLLTMLLLVAGCESQNPAPAAPAGTTVPALNTLPPRTIATTLPPAVTTSMEPEPVPEVTIGEPVLTPAATIVVSGNYHQEYIRMDATTYSVGEVVQFYLVNKGPEISGCDYAHPAYTVYHLSPTGTRLPIATYDPARSYMTVISDPNSATGPFSLDTRKLSPGRYLIRFDCGNHVAREFVIRSRTDAMVN
ncbi:MAG: hypothetical protein LUQ35_10055, partial [Methanoregula sp.]|nr:hypothetical protein [Methanoregula sp.]